jgi:hypothetical protein
MEPELTAIMVLTLAAGYWMVVAGMKKHVFQWLQIARRCPSCGRMRRDCRCRK